MMDETNGISLPPLSSYKLGKTLGKGAFGKVKLATHILTGITVAIKIIVRQSIYEEKVRREITIMRLLSHPHIVKLFEVIETETELYLVMEYMDRGELFDYIIEHSWLEEDHARRFFQQIISGVQSCHLHKVVHRDIKPENLLLDSKGNVKVADFGLANVVRDGRLLKTWCGSINYAAPEILSKRPYAGPEVDVWSCGVVLYALLSGSLPFDDETPALLIKIKNGIFTFPKCFTPGACDLIKRMLTVDPVKRITIPEIYKHPWFRVGLPRYIADPSLNTSCSATKFDVRVLEEMNNLGFNVHEVIASLNNKWQNQATVSYCILLHRRLNNNRTSHEANLLGSSPSQGTNRQHIYVKPVLPDQRKWVLGFECYCSSPQETMRYVLTVFNKLNVKWKKIRAYNLECLWTPPVERYSLPSGMNRITLREDNSVNETFSLCDDVKFEIQLYKDSGESSYVLDWKRVCGAPFLFIEVCFAFRRACVVA